MENIRNIIGYLSSHKLRMLGVLLLLPLLGLGVYLALNPTVFRSRASTIAFSWSPTTAIVRPNESYVVQLLLDSGSTQIAGVDVVLEYPNTDVDIQPSDIQSGGVFKTFIEPKVSGGQISFSALAFDPANPNPATKTGITGNNVIATLTFKPKKEGTFNVRFQSGNLLVSDTTGVNVIDKGDSSTFPPLAIVVGAPVTADCVLSVSPPRTTASVADDNVISYGVIVNNVSTSGLKAYFTGSNGSTSINEALAGDLTGTNTTFRYKAREVDGNGQSGGVFSRQVVVKNSTGGVVCTTNTADLTIDPAVTPTPAPTPAPVPSLTSSSTSPYTCSVSSAYITNASTGAEVASIAPGAPYNMNIKFNVGGSGNNGDLAYTQYQAIFDNADPINVPGKCTWSVVSQQYTCIWEDVLTAGSAGEHNIRFFVRAVGDETTQCIKNGNPVLIRYTSQ